MHAGSVTEKMLDRHKDNPRFACLVGRTQHRPAGLDGISAENYGHTPKGIFD